MNASTERLDYPAIGQTLKTARLAANIPPEKLCKDLKLRANHLQAIEAGNTAALPGSVYTNGYIRMVANYLGIEEAKIFGMKEASPVLPPSRTYQLPENTLRGLLFAIAVGAIFGGMYAMLSQRASVPEASPEIGIPAVPDYLKSYLQPNANRFPLVRCLSYSGMLMIAECAPLTKTPLSLPVASVLDLAQTKVAPAVSSSTESVKVIRPASKTP